MPQSTNNRLALVRFPEALLRSECPKCESERVAPILYGFPSEGVKFDAVEKGEVVLGGCCVTDNDPEWACLGCDHRWGVGG